MLRHVSDLVTTCLLVLHGLIGARGWQVEDRQIAVELVTRHLGVVRCSGDVLERRAYLLLGPFAEGGCGQGEVVAAALHRGEGVANGARVDVVTKCAAFISHATQLVRLTSHSCMPRITWLGTHWFGEFALPTPCGTLLMSHIFSLYFSHFRRAVGYSMPWTIVLVPIVYGYPDTGYYPSCSHWPSYR